MKHEHNPNEEFEHSVLSFWLIVFAIFMCLLVGALNKCHSQTKDEVYTELIRQGVKHPKVVLAQTIKETGWYKCKDCSLDHNNLFGLQYKGKYLEFNTWQESITRYKVFQDKRYDGIKDYLEFLDCIWLHRDGSCARYATSKNYTEELKEIINQL